MSIIINIISDNEIWFIAVNFKFSL